MANPTPKPMQGTDPVHRLVRINYTIRMAGFGFSFMVAGLVGWERGATLPFWLALIATFIAYPHLAYLRSRLSKQPKAAELNNLYVDSALLGCWVAALGLPTWCAYAALQATTLNVIILRGIPAAALSAGIFAAAALAWFLGMGDAFRYQPATGTVVTLMCLFGSLAYVGAVGYVEFLQNRRLVAAREALRRQETRYRLITENVADLVAMVDPEGRWLYASPAYERLVNLAELEPGADAFARAHPDDAEQARSAVRRVSATGKARTISMRLVDRDGRFRQFSTRVQAVEPEITPPGMPHSRLLLVSQDVTDLKESEERLLVAAHALEGMTEAICITAADGTVQTVNQAYTRLTGYTRDDVLGRAERELRNTLQPAEFYDEVDATVKRNGYWTGTIWSRRKNGSVYREWRSLRAVKDAYGAVTHYVMTFYEVGVPRLTGAGGGVATPSET